jgi:transketolase
MMEPSCEAEVALLLDWALNTNMRSSYLRLVSLPLVLPYRLPDYYVPEYGKGIALTEGDDVILFTYGPVMLSVAVEAASLLRSDHGIGLKVVNLPWLNHIERPWLALMVDGYKTVIAVDNHYRHGGQGDRIGDTLHAICVEHSGSLYSLIRIALEEIPECGTNTEILKRHKLDGEAIVHKVLASLR